MEQGSRARRNNQPAGNNSKGLAVAQIEYPFRPTVNLPTSTEAPKSRDDFEIAIICALPLEANAVQALFDTNWEHKGYNYGKASGDPNAYQTGAIGRHNVVLAFMPGMGKANASSVASNLRHSFSGIKLAVVVGICGGVPIVNNKEELVLGDVVISEGIVEYDFGRRFPSGFVKDLPEDSVHHPTQEIRSLLAKLKTEWSRKTLQDKMSEYLCILQEKLGDRVCYPGSKEDKLFASDYNHIYHSPQDCDSCREGQPCNQANAYAIPTCDELKCDENRLVPRRRLEQIEQTGHAMRHIIHFGRVASGDTVMMSGEDRDRMARTDSVIAFEMEGAGVWDNLPCVVVKGVCDYADSHKTKKWQNYAASTAAACVKALLENWAVTSTPQNKTEYSKELVRWIDVVPMHPDDPLRFLALSKRPEWAITQEWSSPNNIFDCISDYEPDRIYGNHFRKKCPGTVGWILNDESFIRWVDNDHSCLWLSGKIGSGKTLATSVIIRHLTEISQRDGTFVAHFFYSQINKTRLEASSLFRSFVKQMIGFLDATGLLCPQAVTRSIKRLFIPLNYSPGLDEIIEQIFIPLSQFISDHTSRTTYIVDGLDECEVSEVQKALKIIQKMVLNGRKVLVSGRDSLDVKRFLTDPGKIYISGEESRQDIRKFIDWKIAEKLEERRPSDDDSVLQSIKSKLNEKADQMILWVSLQIEAIWDVCYTSTDVKVALESLPHDLTETYDRCLKRINSRQIRFAQKILLWVCTMPKPFKSEQLREALGINPTTGRLDRDSLPSLKEVLNCCHNLITLDDNLEVLVTHHSVRQHLERRTIHDELFPDGFNLGKAHLELGELCLSHITSSDYALALQSIPYNQVKLSPKAIERLSETVPPLMKYLWPKPKPRSALVSVPQRYTGTSPGRLPSVFYFARDQWAPLTRTITSESTYWGKFQTLVFEPNSSWELQPWYHAPSRDAYYSEVLGWAVANDHGPMLELLLSRRNPGPKDEIFDLPLYRYSFFPALHLAARNGNSAMVGQLISKCNPEILDSDGRTALHHAAESGTTDIAKLLVTHNVPLNARDSNGDTSIHIAACNNRVDMVRVLASMGADSRITNFRGKTILHLVIENGHTETLLALDDIGADLSETHEGRTMAQLAIEYGRAEIVWILKNDLGIDITEMYRNGWMPLHYASSTGNPEIAQTLVDCGINPNEKDAAGWTPLLHASNNGHISTVERLIQLGADPKEEDLEGVSAAQYAWLNGHELLSRLLSELGVGLDQTLIAPTPNYVRLWDGLKYETLLASLNSTVDDLLQKLRKSDVSSSKNMVLEVKGKRRMLGNKERPGIIQVRLLEKLGYEKKDDLFGSDKAGFEFWKFLVVHDKSLPNVTNLRFSEMLKKTEQSWDDFNFPNYGITALPSSFKNHALSIHSINLSSNPGLNFYAHSLEDCHNLVRLRVANNRLRRLPSYFNHFNALKILDMSSNSLKIFPKQILHLNTLSDLDISFNALESLPDDFGDLCALKTFRTRNNKLQGSLPMSFSTLKKLRYIDLRSNKLVDISVLLNFPALETLYVDDNSVQWFSMGTFEKLQTLSLRSNSLCQFELQSSIPALTSLTMSNIRLVTIPYHVFPRLPNLARLILDDNQLELLPIEIGALSKLTHFSIARNHLRRIPAHMCELEKLMFFDARQNEIDSIPSKLLWDLYHLQTLNLSSNRLQKIPSTEDRRNIAASLKYLSLADNLLHDRDLIEIRHLQQLRVMNLSYNNLNHFPDLRSCGLLEKLYLSGNNLKKFPLKIWDGRLTPCLKVMHLNGNQLVILPTRLRRASSFIVLDCGSNFLTHYVLAELSPRSSPRSKLKHLNFSGNKQLQLIVPSNSPHQDNSKRLDNFLDGLQILGLENVTVATSDGSFASASVQTEKRRVRTRERVHMECLAYGLSDTLGDYEVLTIIEVTPSLIYGRDVMAGIFACKPGNLPLSSSLEIVHSRIQALLKQELRDLPIDQTPVDALRRTFLSLNKGSSVEYNCAVNKDFSTPYDRKPTDDPVVAAVALFRDTTLYIANVGDVQAMILSSDNGHQLLTQKHVPTEPSEIERISKANGWVSKHGKLNDEIAVSRAFGHPHLTPAVSAKPYVSVTTLTQYDEVLVIASAGLWDFLSSDVVAKVALSERGNLTRAAEKLRDFAIAYGSTESMMVMILDLGSYYKSKLEECYEMDAVISRPPFQESQ